MTWFKVDDGLHKHRKRVRVGITKDGFAAMGLWAVAGSWCANELTDGFVPDDVLDYLAPGIGKELASRLERAGFWRRVARDGEEGWQFHDWEDKNPTRAEVLRDRAAAAARQQRARDKAKQQRLGQDGASRRDAGVTHADVTADVTVPPTRPDPTRPEPPPPSPSADGFTPEWTARVVARVRQLRPEWIEADVRKALAHPKVRQRPPAVVEQALLLLAADETTERPSRLSANHGMWTKARQQVAARRRRPGEIAPHKYAPDSSGTCTECPLPQRHPVHQ